MGAVGLFLALGDQYYQYFDLRARNDTEIATISNNCNNSNTPCKLDSYEITGLNNTGSITDKEIMTIQAFDAILLGSLTGILVLVAWIQIKGLTKVSKADFLMRVDDRYGSEPILKARIIIHEFYTLSKTSDKDKLLTEKQHRYFVANEINKLSSDPTRCEKYIHILNLLDFLETISFYANHEDIEDSDIENLMGLSLTFYYDVLEMRIDERRKKYSNPSYYCEFETLVNRMKCERTLLH